MLQGFSRLILVADDLLHFFVKVFSMCMNQIVLGLLGLPGCLPADDGCCRQHMTVRDHSFQLKIFNTRGFMEELCVTLEV